MFYIKNFKPCIDNFKCNICIILNTISNII